MNLSVYLRNIRPLESANITPTDYHCQKILTGLGTIFFGSNQFEDINFEMKTETSWGKILVESLGGVKFNVD